MPSDGRDGIGQLLPLRYSAVVALFFAGCRKEPLAKSAQTVSPSMTRVTRPYNVYPSGVPLRLSATERLDSSFPIERISKSDDCKDDEDAE
jgi:hypothetical protein